LTRAKILLVDIETAPSLGYYFDLWKEGNIINTKANWYMLSFAYQWLGEKSVKTFALPDYPGFRANMENDKYLCRDLWKLLDEADVVVAHNGDRFDLPKANARFLVHGFSPTRPYKTVDTLKIARKHFRFESNRLDSLARALGIGAKLPNTGTHLWLSCMAGQAKAWKKMREYNAHDVRLLAAVYDRLKPWATNHPNLSHLSRNPAACPTCESTKTKQNGWKFSASGKKAQHLCRDCGHYFLAGKHFQLGRV
jgi:hypothetical protein